jgi:ADP-ribosyl-[dinitrogen reductase] hydrolase
MKKNLEDKFVGAIVGAAIGDALGAPLEFLNLIQRKNKFGVVNQYIKSDWGVGKYTDDTQLTLVTANTIIDSKGYSSEDFLKKLIDWYKTQIDGTQSRAPGIGTMESCRNLYNGAHEDMNKKIPSFGCGSAMRTSPIGLFYHDNNTKLIKSACNSSNFTHNNQKGRFGATVSAYAVARALDKIDSSEEYLDDLISFSESLPDDCIDFDFLDKIKKMRKNIGQSTEHVQELFNDGFLVDGVVPQAIFIFSKNYGDFEKTVVEAANYGADSDSVGCIAGAISGAYNGFSKIPQKFLDKLENKDLLISTGIKLLETKQGVQK